jgi:hypothetical protein
MRRFYKNVYKIDTYNKVFAQITFIIKAMDVIFKLSYFHNKSVIAIAIDKIGAFEEKMKG